MSQKQELTVLVSRMNQRELKRLYKFLTTGKVGMILSETHRRAETLKTIKSSS